MNNIFVVFTFFLLFSSCIGKHNSDAQKAAISYENENPKMQTAGDTIQIDITKSSINWKGTKMKGAGKHEGEIELKNGYLIIKDGEIEDGHFIVDMTTIGVTDIPEHEPVPRKNLNNHLKSSDFFNVKNFPISKFDITKVKQIKSDSIVISGNLTLKDVTKNIEFGANYYNEKFTTKFTFDRFQWNIAYEGNWADKTFVDKDIELAISLETR